MKKQAKHEVVSSRQAYGIIGSLLSSIDQHLAEAKRGEVHSKHQLATHDRMLVYAQRLAVVAGELRKGEVAAAKEADLDPARVLEWLRRRSPADRRQLAAEIDAMDRRTSVL